VLCGITVSLVTVKVHCHDELFEVTPVYMLLRMQAHLLSSLVHSILHKKSRVAGNRDEVDDDRSEDEIVESTELMLRSLVERMVKCEPEDFELVCLSFFQLLLNWPVPEVSV